MCAPTHLSSNGMNGLTCEKLICENTTLESAHNTVFIYHLTTCQNGYMHAHIVCNNNTMGPQQPRKGRPTIDCC